MSLICCSHCTVSRLRYVMYTDFAAAMQVNLISEDSSHNKRLAYISQMKCSIFWADTDSMPVSCPQMHTCFAGRQWSSV